MITRAPESRTPLARALAAAEPALIVEAAPIAAYGVAVSVGSYGGRVVLAGDEALREAQGALPRDGI